MLAASRKCSTFKQRVWSLEDRAALAEIICEDAIFLGEQGLLDYSLLLGIYRIPREVLAGQQTCRVRTGGVGGDAAGAWPWRIGAFSPRNRVELRGCPDFGRPMRHVRRGRPFWFSRPSPSRAGICTAYADSRDGVGALRSFFWPRVAPSTGLAVCITQYIVVAYRILYIVVGM